MTETYGNRSIIAHRECYGYDAKYGIPFVNESTICIKTGNSIQLCRIKNDSLELGRLINGENTGFSSIAA